MDQYSVMANNMTSLRLLMSLTQEDKAAAIQAANAFRLVSDFLEGKAPSQVTLDILIEAEKTYERLMKAVS